MTVKALSSEESEDEHQEMELERKRENRCVKRLQLADEEISI